MMIMDRHGDTLQVEKSGDESFLTIRAFGERCVVELSPKHRRKLIHELMRHEGNFEGEEHF